MIGYKARSRAKVAAAGRRSSGKGRGTLECRQQCAGEDAFVHYCSQWGGQMARWEFCHWQCWLDDVSVVGKSPASKSYNIFGSADLFDSMIPKICQCRASRVLLPPIHSIHGETSTSCRFADQTRGWFLRCVGITHSTSDFVTGKRRSINLCRCTVFMYL